MHIVLAEDNPADVLLVREALREHGIDHSLHVIDDGDAALAFIDHLDANSTARCPDLLLLDLHLPKRNGGEILRYLRASERCAQTPVVVLTSSESPRDQENAERHAAVHYFVKPSRLGKFMELGTIVKAFQPPNRPLDA